MGYIQDQFNLMNHSWKLFRRWIEKTVEKEWKCKIAYVAVVEFTKNNAPHIHFVIGSENNIPPEKMQGMISKKWESYTGAFINYFDRVRKDTFSALRYIMKYVRKAKGTSGEAILWKLKRRQYSTSIIKDKREPNIPKFSFVTILDNFIIEDCEFNLSAACELWDIWIPSFHKDRNGDLWL
tara:strand:- start:2064 stop:2606 length:543 start_codon:yes stop_codon:yes gene_type:complete